MNILIKKFSKIICKFSTILLNHMTDFLIWIYDLNYIKISLSLKLIFNYFYILIFFLSEIAMLLLLIFYLIWNKKFYDCIIVLKEKLLGRAILIFISYHLSFILFPNTIIFFFFCKYLYNQWPIQIDFYNIVKFIDTFFVNIILNTKKRIMSIFLIIQK